MSSFVEPIRLVIWDLDDTFWQGTIAEGAVSVRHGAAGIVRTLAERGIVSSILSKNDHEVASRELTKHEVWDYFVLPSINWDPKGPRIRQLVEDVQLRPASILFIDDNPSNLEEAKHFCPDIQIADQHFVAEMLDHEQFQGKPDPSLNRLKQYKLLEKRTKDRKEAKGDTNCFLRQSNIQVTFDYLVEEKLDRAIELVNRTNQLNFTKNRLAEDLDAAREQLRAQLHHFSVLAALVNVKDAYGDHGTVGFYLQNDDGLLHFCFSCRILGMGVERWLYQLLRRPTILISGEIQADLSDTSEINWINQAPGTPTTNNWALKRPGWVLARGGCELTVLSHYFSSSGSEIIPEFSLARNGVEYRIDHSQFARYALTGGLSAEQAEVARGLGYTDRDFETKIGVRRPGNGVAILSLWMDCNIPMFRHRESNLIVPFFLPTLTRANGDDGDMRPPKDEVSSLPPALQRAALTLIEDYDFVGLINEEDYKTNLCLMLDAIGETPTFVIGINDKFWSSEYERFFPVEKNVAFNQWTVDVLSRDPKAKFLDVRDCLANEREVRDWAHFDRAVYFRMFEAIMLNL